MNINDMADIAYKNAVRLGKIGDRGDVEKLKDVQLEYMEALKALNNDHFAHIENVEPCMKYYSFFTSFTSHVKDTYEDELTDLLSVVLTLMKDRKMDIVKHFKYKQKYNELREDHK